MSMFSNRLRSVSEIRQSIDQYQFDNPNVTLRESKWLQSLARELAFALQRERSINELQRIEMIRVIDHELSDQKIH